MALELQSSVTNEICHQRKQNKHRGTFKIMFTCVIWFELFMSIIPWNHICYFRFNVSSVQWVEWLYLEHGHDTPACSLRCKQLVQAGELLGATLSLFYVGQRENSRPEVGAFIRSLQTGFLGEKVEEQIEVDYKSVEEGRRRKCNRFCYGHLYLMRPIGLQGFRERRRCWFGNSEN